MSESTDHRDMPMSATLTVKKKADGPWQVSLNDLPLEGLLAVDGLRIEAVDTPEDAYPGAQVTLTFSPDALDLDIDVDMLATVVAQGGES